MNRLLNNAGSCLEISDIARQLWWQLRDSHTRQSYRRAYGAMPHISRTVQLSPTVCTTSMKHSATYICFVREYAVQSDTGETCMRTNSNEKWRRKLRIRFPGVSVHSKLTLWCRNYFFLILAHPVYKMWIIQEPNKLALWNELHFEEKKTESIEHV